MDILIRTVLFLTLLTGHPANAKNARLVVPYENVLTVTETSPLDLWIEKLAYAESSGQENIRILDSNNRYSYGCLQFQELTFKSFSERYHLFGDLMDCQLQKQIAKRMIQEDPENWRHWYNSVKLLGPPPTP